MYIPNLLSINKFLWISTNILLTVTILADNANGKPQDAFQDIVMGGITIISQAAEILSNGAAVRKDHDFELPFAKARSKSEVGMGEAVIHRKDSESSEEDRKRRKRSVDYLSADLIGEELLLPVPQTKHLHHIFKRSPCHTMGTGGGTGGTGGTGGGTGGGIDGDIDDGDLTIAERRRRARMRKAAAKKRAKSSKKTTKKTKRKLVSSDVAETLTRRKRQSEQDDLNANMTNASKDLTQHAQQFAEKVQSIFNGFVNSMSQMAEAIRQKFSGNSSSTTEEI